MNRKDDKNNVIAAPEKAVSKGKPSLNTQTSISIFNFCSEETPSFARLAHQEQRVIFTRKVYSMGNFYSLRYLPSPTHQHNEDSDEQGI
ncbi:hypothetical protein [Pragia fontium]|uniref:hypothetical protein n=1 Tax=Pragia fontium TaxID=82985 RepID=UPI0011C06BFA|nr:hypothetical protein [Pragia fontium]